MEEQLKQDIKVWGLPVIDPPNRYPLNICYTVARELGIDHTIIMYNYGVRS